MGDWLRRVNDLIERSSEVIVHILYLLSGAAHLQRVQMPSILYSSYLKTRSNGRAVYSSFLGCIDQESRYLVA